MADDRNEINPGAGEDEYHFNDEHADYDMSVAASQASPPAGTKKLSSLFQDKRRILVGVVVFLMLVSVVYKMLAPSSTSTPSTDIVAPPPATTKATPAPQSAPAVTTSASPQQATAPATEKKAEAASSETQPVAETITEKPAPMPVAVPKPVEPVQPVQQQAAYVSTPPVSAASNEAVNSLAGRMSGLEQQNVAILNTVQTQYGQKISDLESQNNQIQRELQDLKSDLTEVKQAFHQLSAILQKEASVGANTTASKPVEAAKNMKTAKDTGYTVQAIIPGRAWLKSASGDTVTVAEGDTLRGVGRVVRIDPYDGIVNLDTGNKTVTLSYGMGADD